MVEYYIYIYINNKKHIPQAQMTRLDVLFGLFLALRSEVVVGGVT